MKKFVFTLILLSMTALCPLLANLPREVVVLRLPASEQEKWREAHRLVKKSGGEIQFVPFRQRIACCKELLEVAYLDRSLLESRYVRSMKTVLNFLSSQVIDHKTWKLIEMRDDYALVEWTNTLTYKLARIFLTEKYIHMVSIGGNEEPNQEERLARIAMLQNVPCVLSAKEALSTEGLCILSPLSIPVNMHEGFPGWRLGVTEYPDNGDRVFIFFRKWEKEEELHDSIVLVKFAHTESLERAFEAISLVLKDNFKQVQITRLAQNDGELALMFEAKEEGQFLTKVIRIFRKDDAILCLRYECFGVLSKNEAASWLEKMRRVKFD